MSDMAVELWSRLPAELTERTLSFLSVPVLCRFRTVCKRWNLLICKPEFGALCKQHARQDACFIVLRYAVRPEYSPDIDFIDHDQLGSFGVNHGWCFLDVSARRWYTIKRDGQGVFDSSEFGRVAMDGGLVYQHMYAGGEDVSVFVSNPIAKTSIRLPDCTATFDPTGTMPEVNMIVDDVANSYKIYVMPTSGIHGNVSPDESRMVVYESTTKQWRNLTILQTPLLGFHFHVLSSVFLNGLLYVLMSPCTTRTAHIAQDNCLWSYNPDEDIWKNTGVDIHMRPLELAELIVIDNRLFLALWMHHGHSKRDHWRTWSPDGWTYEISEVFLEERTHRRVFEMTEAVVKHVFKVSDSSCVRLNAIGFGKSIVLLCKSSGVSILCDLNTSLWESLPVNPLVPQGEGYWQLLWYGSKPMNLIMPMWDQYHETEAESTGAETGV